MGSEAKYQTVWRRFWAGGVDFLVISPLWALAMAASAWPLPPATKIALTVVYSMCVHAYSVLMHWRFGATVGKLVLGVRVVDAHGGAISFRQALFRDAISIVLSAYSVIVEIARIGTPAELVPERASTILAVSEIVVAIDVLTALTNVKRRSLHDFVAGTVVVRRRAMGSGEKGTSSV